MRSTAGIEAAGGSGEAFRSPGDRRNQRGGEEGVAVQEEEEEGKEGEGGEEEEQGEVGELW